MTAQDFSVSGQQVLVVGAARSGVAAAELLVRRGASVTLTDRKPQIPEEAALRAAGVALELGGHVAATFEAADLIVMSPGVPLELPEVARAQARGVPVIGELELASRWLRGPIVAITGTKGKSTTTTLVGRMLEAAGRRVLVGGNIGVPLSAQVDASTDDTVHVVEASSFQLEATDTFRPWIAALLNFSPDHLDRHPDEAAYAAAEGPDLREPAAARLGGRQRRQPGGDARWRDTCARASCVTASRHADADVHVGRGFIWQRTSEGDIPLVPLAAVQLPGRHMLSNVAAATAISHLAGATGDALARALDGFTGLEHVMEPVGIARRRALRQRLEGDQRRCGGESIESFDKVVAIVGGRSRAATSRISRSRCARTGARWSRSAKRGRWCARRWPTWCRSSRPSRWPTRCGGRGSWRCPTAWCCSRRRVRASTCSRTTRIAGGSSRRKCEAVLS